MTPDTAYEQAIEVMAEAIAAFWGDDWTEWREVTTTALDALLAAHTDDGERVIVALTMEPVQQDRDGVLSTWPDDLDLPDQSVQLYVERLHGDQEP